MEYLGVMVKCTIPQWQQEDNGMDVALPLNSIHHFDPDQIINNLDGLRALKEKLIMLKDLKRKIGTNPKFSNDLLKSINDKSWIQELFNDSMDNNQDKGTASKNHPKNHDHNQEGSTPSKKK
jgi:type VI secretion system ImpB/VipA family protein